MIDARPLPELIARCTAELENLTLTTRPWHLVKDCRDALRLALARQEPFDQDG